MNQSSQTEPGEIVEINQNIIIKINLQLNIKQDEINKIENSDSESTFFKNEYLNKKRTINEEENKEKKQILCKYFKKGNCNKGYKCIYSHSKNNIPCKFYHLYKNCTKKIASKRILFI